MDTKKTNGTAFDTYSLVMENTKRIGDKAFAWIPLSILEIDDAFQRGGVSSRSKIMKLCKNWNINKMDPLKVSPHPESKTFSVIDGYHRYEAAKMLGIDNIECEILDGMDIAPKDRLLREAMLFATQDDEVERLTHMQKHKANIVLGKRENIILQKMIEKYHINFTMKQGNSCHRAGYLSSFATALNLAKVSEPLIDDTFNVINGAGWNFTEYGYMAWVINMVFDMLLLYGQDHPCVARKVQEFMRAEGPEKFQVDAAVKYPAYKKEAQRILFLEDFVCRTFGIERKYKREGKAIVKKMAKKESEAA